MENKIDFKKLLNQTKLLKDIIKIIIDMGSLVRKSPHDFIMGILSIVTLVTLIYILKLIIINNVAIIITFILCIILFEKK